MSSSSVPPSSFQVFETIKPAPNPNRFPFETYTPNPNQSPLYAITSKIDSLKFARPKSIGITAAIGGAVFFITSCLVGFVAATDFNRPILEQMTYSEKPRGSDRPPKLKFDPETDFIRK